VSGNQAINLVGGEGPGTGLGCFTEDFAGGITSFDLRSGSKAEFSVITTDQGQTMRVNGGPPNAQSLIFKSVVCDRIRTFRCRFQVKSSLIDDSGYLTIGQASPSAGYLVVLPRRELAFDGLARMQLQMRKAAGDAYLNLPIGTAALALNVWHEVVVTFSSIKCEATVKVLETGQVLGVVSHTADYSNLFVNALYISKDNTVNCNVTWFADLEFCGLITGANRGDDLTGFRLNMTRGAITAAQSGNLPVYTLGGMRLTLNATQNILNASSTKLTGIRMRLGVGTLVPLTYQEPTRTYYNIVINGTKGGEEQFGYLSINPDGTLVTSWDSATVGVWASPVQANLGNKFDVKIEAINGTSSAPLNVFTSLASPVTLAWGSFGAGFRITVRPGPSHINYGVAGQDSFGDIDIRLSNPGS
jgi:hypothetical protein